MAHVAPRARRAAGNLCFVEQAPRGSGIGEVAAAPFSPPEGPLPVAALHEEEKPKEVEKSGLAPF